MSRSPFAISPRTQQPDHDSLCTFRKRFLKEIEALFVQVLCIARQMIVAQAGHDRP